MTTIWTAGASSAAKLIGDGEFSFVLGRGAAAVAVGITPRDSGTDPTELTHGVLVESGRWCVLESGRRKTVLAPAPYPLTRFFITRYGNGITISTANANVGDPGGTTLPSGDRVRGTLVYTSEVPSTGDVVLDASLGAVGDEVRDAALTAALGPLNIASFALKPAVPDFTLSNAGNRIHIRVAAPGLSFNQVSFSAAIRPPLPDIWLSNIGNAVQLQVPAPEIKFSNVVVDAAFNAISIKPTAPGVKLHVDNNLSIALRVPAPRLNFQGAGDITLRVPRPGFTLSNVGNRIHLHVPPPRMSAFFMRVPNTAHIVGVLPALTHVLPADRPGPVVAHSIALASDDAPPGIPALVTHSIALALDITAGQAPPEPLIAHSVAIATDKAVSLPAVLVAHSVAVATDEAPLGAPALIAESVAIAADVAVAAPMPLPAATSVAMAIDEPVGWGAALVTQSTALATDEAPPGIVVLRAESVAWALDESVPLMVPQPLITEAVALALDETVSLAPLGPLVAESVAIATDDASIPLTAAQTAALVLTTATGAVATWNRWPLTDLAQLADGTVLAISPQGLCVLGAPNDDGAQIDARVTTGWTDWGGYDQDGNPKPSPQLKRLENVWLATQNTGPMQVTLRVQGRPAYTYQTQQSPTGIETNQRAIPGKGLAGRYWQVEVANVAGADFEVTHMAADVAESSRRI